MLLSQYFVCYIIYGFLGWMYESFFYSVQFKRPVNTGFLHICFCPIYGFACVGNAIVFRNIESPAVIFVVSMLLISILEYITSYFLERTFSRRWWDYSDWPCNINGRVSLFSSLGFGTLSLMQMKLIHPAVAGVVTRLSDKMTDGIIALFLMVIALDLMLSIKEIERGDRDLWFVDEELPGLQKANERIEETVKVISERYSDMRRRIRGRWGR